MASKKPSPKAREEQRPSPKPPDESPGSNAARHEPDPRAKPIPDGEHKYIRRSPFTAGND